MSNPVQSTYTIQSMTAALRNLEYVPTSERTVEYQEIYNKIKQFISINCVHKIVSDSIDTDIDSSQPIKYCIHCEQTFDCKPFNR